MIFGDWGFLHEFNTTLAGWQTMTWVVVLLLYSYVASVLPVWTLLQPRDYINSLQLLTMLALIVVGLCVAAFIGGAPLPGAGAVEGVERPALELATPMVNWVPEAAPMIFPFLFIIIACGAISGFHYLVSSGTSSKQIFCETDAQFIGYGSMLTEGFLATLVILACAAGLGLGVSGGIDGTVLTCDAAFTARYSSWASAGGLGAKIGAFVDGSANFLKAIGIPGGIATAFMGVLVASFAGTTLDTACRLQRYVIQELAGTFGRGETGLRPVSSTTSQQGEVVDTGGPSIQDVGSLHEEAAHHGSENRSTSGFNPLAILTNKHAATIFAVTLGGVIAALPPAGEVWSWSTAGTGGLLLWPMFGATNQLLGGLAFLVVAFWLWRRKLPIWFIIPPMLFMPA